MNRLKSLLLTAALALAVFSVCAIPAQAATGDITLDVNPDGWSVPVSTAGFTSGATYDFDLRGKIYGTFTTGTFSDGATVTQTSTGITAKVVGTQSSGTFLLIKTLSAEVLTTNTWTSGGATFTPTSCVSCTIPGPNTPYLTVVSEGYSNASPPVLGTISRKVWITAVVNVPYSSSTIAGSGGTPFGGTSVADGVTVTQGTTGATAVTVGAQANQTLLRVRTVTGSPDTSHTWTGGGLTFTPSAIPVTMGVTVSNAVKDELAQTAGLVTRMALSDYVYIDDNSGGGKSGTIPTVTIPAGFIVNSGGLAQSSNALTGANVTNQNSTVTYATAPPVARFVSFPFKLIAGAFSVECQAFHRHGMNGNPVAGVLFTLTDGTVTRTYTATSMTLSSDPDALPVYAVTDNASNFTQGANITCRIQVYPYVGDASAVLDSSAFAWANDGMRLGNLPVGVCDKTGAYGVTYCAVGSGGSDSNTAAYTSQAAAEAGLKTATIGGAAANIKAYNNTNHGGRNTVDAGVIVVDGAGYLFGDGTGGGSHSACALTITRNSTTTRASAKITGFAGSRFVSTITRIYDMSVVASSSSNQLICFPNSACPLLVEDANVTGVGGNPNLVSGATNNGVNAVMWKNVTMTGYNKGMNCANDNCSILARGCNVSGCDNTSPAFGSIRAVVGCTFTDTNGTPTGGTTFYVQAATAWTEYGNYIISYNKNYAEHGGFFDHSAAVNNIAIVCNVDERVVVSNVIASLSTTGVTNAIVLHNTWVGERFNTEIGASVIPLTLNAFSYNSFQYVGTHAPQDVNNSDGALMNPVAPYSTFQVSRKSNNVTYNPAGIVQFWGIGSSYIAPAGYTLDASKDGTNAGNGNYTPTAASILRNRIAAGESMLAFDINRNAIPNDGTGAIGAFQYVANAGTLFFRRR